MGLLQWLSGKESTCNSGDTGSIPGWGRSPGEGNGNPLQYSCLENSMDREAWWATVHGVTKSRIQPSDWACIHTRPVDKVTRKHALKNTQPGAPQMLKPCERWRVSRGGSAPMCRPHSHCTRPGSWTTHFPDFPLQPLEQENADPLRVPYHPAASSPTQFRSLVW